MQNLEELKKELSELLEQNSALHNKYVVFQVETPENTYHITMSVDKFLEYVDEDILLSKGNTSSMSNAELEMYKAVVLEKFLSDLKSNFNSYAKSGNGYSCMITDIKDLTELDPQIELMGELLMAEYAISTYRKPENAVQTIEKSVKEEYGDILDGSTYRFNYTKTESLSNIDYLKGYIGDSIECKNNSDIKGAEALFFIEENEDELVQRRVTDGEPKIKELVNSGYEDLDFMENKKQE